MKDFQRWAIRMVNGMERALVQNDLKTLKTVSLKGV